LKVSRSLSLAQIHAALSYYYDHQAEIDAEIADQMKQYQDLRTAAADSPLRQKLEQLGKMLSLARVLLEDVDARYRGRLVV